MKLTKSHIFLTLLFLIVLILRLSITLNLPYFSSDEAYFHFRHIEHLVEEHSALREDTLSYGGREIIYPPFYHTFLAFLSFGSFTLLKILPELLAATFVFIAYVLGKQITNNDYAALAGTVLANFLPIYFWETLNTLSIYTLLIPLIYLILYLYLKLENKTALLFFALLVLMYTLTHPSAFLIIATLLMYFFLLAGGALNSSHLEREAAWYSFITILLVEFFLYRKAFLAYGLNILWQNTPVVILADKFRGLDVLELFLAIGVLPLVLGGIGIYSGITTEKKKSVYILSALMLTTLILIALRLLTIATGLVLLGTSLAILSSLAFHKIFLYLQKLRFPSLTRFYPIVVAILIIFLVILPNMDRLETFDDIPREKINDLTWARMNLDQDATILGTIQEGNLITAIAERKNVIDQDFLLAPDPVERLNDVEDLYRIVSIAKAKELFNKYNITAIYFSPETQAYYNTENPRYATDGCFKREGRFYLFTC